MGIVGRSVPAAQRGDTEFLSLTVVSCTVGAVVFLAFIAGMFASYGPAQICAQRLRHAYPDDFVFAASMKVGDVIEGFDTSSLGPGDHRPPLAVFAMKATAEEISFWAGVRHQRKFLQIPWVLVKHVDVDRHPGGGKRLRLLNIELIDPAFPTLEPADCGRNVARLFTTED
ncbi:hypothetical protein KIV56_12575 [Cryobacterium breve]|uniref:Uncharacterized protein n=1 Tax=Cryobacterium breve TaxID=1259258 RepID=A0ABY7N9U6_9MICO|nr:hypothetical protein [Cryobacterium breve]WBM79276.1 hypothetical protein KIV56_12575 [Cryobacterium breve]